MGHVPHPTMKDLLVAVNVPTTAKVGQAMLVPLPSGAPKPVEVVEPDAPQAAKLAKLEEGPEKEAAKKKWSTGAKVATGTAGVAVAGGLAVAGAVLGDELSDVATSVGDGILDFADLVSDAADSAGGFVVSFF